LANGFGGLPGLGSQLGDSHPPRLVLHEFMRVTQVAELGSQPLGCRLAYMLHITNTHHHNQYAPPTTTHTHTHTQTQRIPKTSTTNSRKHSKTAHKIPAPNPKFNAAALDSDRANTYINPLSMGSQCSLSCSGNPGCSSSIWKQQLSKKPRRNKTKQNKKKTGMIIVL
jgi:hypothetical protein